MERKKLMVVDNDEVILKVIKNGLDKDFEVNCFSSSLKALSVINKDPFDLIIVDINMPEIDGIQFIKEVQKKYPQQKFMVITGFPSLSYSKELLSLGVKHMLEKPFSIERLKELIELCFKEESIVSGNVNIDLTTFLQVLSYDKKSSIINVKSNKGKGVIYIENGVIKRCKFNQMEGIDAIVEILKLEDYIYTQSPYLPIKSNFSLPVEHALMEAAKRIDEKGKEQFEKDEGKREFNDFIAKLKNELGDALLSCELLRLSDFSSLISYNIKKGAYRVFNQLTLFLKEELKKTAKMYLIDVKGGNVIIVVPLHNYQCGIYIDPKKIQLGLLLNILLPKIIDQIEEILIKYKNS